MSKCRLCGNEYSDEDMSEEHYPAQSVGNNDIVKLDIIKLIDLFSSQGMPDEIRKRMLQGSSFEKAAESIFDEELTSPIYPKGRTARTLCRTCNTFLGKYDEAYMKFFNCDGNPKVVRGFQSHTKQNIIKAIFGKFLSIPEALGEEFDFTEYIRDESQNKYKGQWNLYFIRRDNSTDLLGLQDIQTGSVEFEEGIVYELSDDKFIFNLMNFEKHNCFRMNDIFDIYDKNYDLIIGAGSQGGYHAQVFMKNVFDNVKNIK